MDLPIRPNVRWGQACGVEPDETAMEKLSIGMALFFVGTIVLLALIADNLNDFWTGFVVGGLSLAVIGVLLLTLGICIGGESERP